MEEKLLIEGERLVRTMVLKGETMKKLPKVMLGANPFHAVSYKSSELRKQYRQTFKDADSVYRILEASFELGVTGVHSYAKDIEIEAIIRAKKKYGDKLSVVSVLPDIYGAMQRHLGSDRMAGNFAKIKTLMSNAGTLFSVGVKGDLLPLFNKIMDTELDFVKQTAPDFILLHGSLADLALGAERKELLNLWFEKVMKMGVVPGIATHNYGTAVKKIEKMLIDCPVIMAPVNLKGFMMNPSKEECIRLIKNRTATKIIAKKVLAGGVLDPLAAQEYVFREVGVDSVAIGIASIDEAVKTFSASQRVMEKIGRSEMNRVALKSN